MVLSRLTKITGPGIRTDTNWVGNNANYTGILTAASLGGIGNITATGIITASSFSGDGSGLIGVASTDNIVTGTAATFNTYPVDINAGMTVAGVATFAGNVSIAGTLTYEDVTNIDSVGLVTARTGVVSPYADIDDFISVGSNIHLGNAGVITATSFVGSGAALTGIDATSIKDSGGNVKIQAQASGAIHTGVSTFQDIDVDGHTNLDNVSVAGVSTFTDDVYFDGATAGRDIVFDRSDNQLEFAPNAKAVFGGSYPLTIYNNINSYISQNYQAALFIESKDVQIYGSGGGYNYPIFLARNGIVELGYQPSGGSGSIQLKTSAKGITVGTGVTIETNGQATFTGIVTATGADINGDLNVDGNLDIADSIRHLGDSNTKIRFPAADTFAVETAGSERLRITSDGKVGINKTNPEQELHIVGDSDACVRLTCTDGGVASFQLGDASDTVIGGITLDSSDNSIQIRGNNNSERLRIPSGGGLAIGTGSPTRTPLHVHEPTTATANIHLTNSSSGSGATDGLTIFLDNTPSAGVWFRESGALRFATGNTERLRIDANGNAQFGGVVGSGPWSDNAGSSNGAEEILDFGSGTANRGFGWGGTTGNYANIWTEYSSGDLNIASGLRPTGQSQGYVSSYGGSSIGRSNMELRLTGEILFRTAASSTVSTGSAVSTLKQKMRITSGTAVEIGEGTGSDGCGLAIYGGTNNNVSGQDAVFYVRGDTASDWGMLLQKTSEYGFRMNTNSAATLSFAIYDQSNNLKHQFKGNGDYTAQGYVDSASDIKLKTNIKTIDNALDKVLQLRGAEYDRIDKDNQHEIGVIAQEVEKVIPEVVHGEETKTVSYGNMTAVLIEAIKEQNEVINKMKKEIEDLKG